ncbi:HD domain-containing protein [Pedobacter terrae]|uniref:HD domain-containing protein n=1 Tax=Pedobacter terrae TaxID=405671 RepID=UPI002FF5726A
MNYKKLQEDVEKYVVDYFHTHSDPRLVYHNLEHTQEVVNAAQQIANHYQLNEQDFFTVMAAAYFHDTGYFEDALNHEAKGAVLADDFLARHQVNQEIRDQVKACNTGYKDPTKP